MLSLRLWHVISTATDGPRPMWASPELETGSVVGIIGKPSAIAQYPTDPGHRKVNLVGRSVANLVLSKLLLAKINRVRAERMNNAYVHVPLCL